MKSFKKAFFLLVILFLSLIILMQYPSLFIDKKYNYESFTVYSNDDLKLDQDAKSILDSVHLILSKSAFYKKDQSFELYFVKGTFYESITKLFGINNIASSKFNKHLYYGNPIFKENKLVKSAHEYGWVNLIQIISHEGVHSQMYEDYSLLGFMQTPSWINEGYCEFVSYAPLRDQLDYDFENLFKKYENLKEDWVQTEHLSMTPRLYLRDRLIMEYLINHKNLSIYEIIKNKKLNPEELISEISSH